MATYQERFHSRPSQRPAQFGLAFIGGLAVGGTLMYLFDPRAGTRRRAVLKDKTKSAARRYLHLGGRLSRHLRNQAQGLFALTTGTIRQSGVDSDAKVEARVRSALGRTISHAHAVDISVSQGCVYLRGALMPHEAGLVVRATELVRGVLKVENLLTPPIEEGASPIQ